MEARRRLCEEIRACAHVGIGIATVEEIDEINILWATMLAMERAVAALAISPMMVLVDGNRLPRWDRPSKAIVSGDALCLSIAAASIIAKEERDRMMIDLDGIHPGYGWAQNKGYGTPAHIESLGRLGPSPIHRRSFAPIAQFSLFAASGPRSEAPGVAHIGDAAAPEIPAAIGAIGD